MAVSVALSLWFVKGSYDIWRRDEVMAEVDKYVVEKAFFRFSLLYLFVIFAAYLIEAALKLYDLGGW
jgi:protoheme IX farnesyltransferase